ncbi:S-adenosyl-L-methionine-dependent methyltransferase [Bisporella sp. PMI_857]|nr:S-adenosyl-L-methionine-dependent methyltransferase [Bisporella sp. PMI_857]
MSLYYEAAEILIAPNTHGGSLKSRIFSKKDLKSQPSQIYALAIETSKWSCVLKEVVEFSDILRLESKLSPILSLMLVHDLLLAKRGISLPPTHGLRAAIERHKNRLQAEFTKARIRRKIGSIEALKAHIENGLENAPDGSEAPYPRWVRINTLKTTLSVQLDSTFAGYKQVKNVNAVRSRGEKVLYVDEHVENLIAVSPSVDLSKSEAYKNGELILQDKASCFPAFLLNPGTEDGDVIDSCSAPGNKTTHIAAILRSGSQGQTIHAFEKNKGRAETLGKMVGIAGSDGFTKLYPGQDFLKANPNSAVFSKVGALLLDPSCSGSGIVGRDEMPELHLPVLKQNGASNSKDTKKGGKHAVKKDDKKRKRDENEDVLDVIVDDDGVVTAMSTEDELKARLEALSTFQLELLLHAFKFPAAKKITYSTCSIHAEENELVVKKALASGIAKQQGWRLLRREEQIKGMREWPVRGDKEACGGDEVLAKGCIRANKGDEHGTMGFFLAGFVRDSAPTVNNSHADIAMVGDEVEAVSGVVAEGEEWGGIEEDNELVEAEAEKHRKATGKNKTALAAQKHSFGVDKIRPGLVPKGKKRKKGKSNN